MSRRSEQEHSLVGRAAVAGTCCLILASCAAAQVRIDLVQDRRAHAITGASEGNLCRYWADGTAIGDLNADGIDDIAVTATSSDPAVPYDVVVVFGPFPLERERGLDVAVEDYRIHGVAGVFLGVDIEIADVNGDGMDDLAVAMPGYRVIPGRGGRGAVAVMFGPLPRGGRLDLAVQAPDLIILGDDTACDLSPSLEAGDLTGDGINDLAVGADCGTSYDVSVFRGPLPRGTWDLVATPPTTKIVGLWGDRSGEELGGGTMRVADFSGDGVGDLALLRPAAREAGPTPVDGHVSIFVGPLAEPTIDIATNRGDIVLVGVTRASLLESSIEAADLNGDGRMDLAVMQPRARGPDGSAECGQVAAFLGPLALGERDVDVQPAEYIFHGWPAYNRLWSIVAGDLNGDGVTDVAIGGLSHGPPCDQSYSSGICRVLIGPVAAGAHDFAAESADIDIFGDRPSLLSERALISYRSGNPSSVLVMTAGYYGQLQDHRGRIYVRDVAPPSCMDVGLLMLRKSSSNLICSVPFFAPALDQLAWNLYAGSLSSLHSSGVYDHAAVSGACQRTSSSFTWTNGAARSGASRYLLAASSCLCNLPSEGVVGWASYPAGPVRIPSAVELGNTACP